MDMRCTPLLQSEVATSAWESGLHVVFVLAWTALDCSCLHTSVTTGFRAALLRACLPISVNDASRQLFLHAEELHADGQHLTCSCAVLCSLGYKH